MTIQSVLGSKSAEVFAIRATETVKSAAEQMRQHGISALVVKGGGVRRLAARGRSNLAGGVGRHEPFRRHGCPRRQPMIRQRVRDLPVMADGELVGVVSMSDVAKYRLEDLETESNVLRDAYIALAVAKPT